MIQAIIQVSAFYHSYAMLGEIFDDSVCRLTNTTCGINMVFKPIAQLNKSKNLFNSQKCIQRCSCVTDEYEEKDGNCIKKIDKDSNEQVNLNQLQDYLLLGYSKQIYKK